MSWSPRRDIPGPRRPPGARRRGRRRVHGLGAGAHRRPRTASRSRRPLVRDAVICEPVRTAVGSFGGALRDVPTHELAATVIRAVLDRTGLPDDAVDDVVLGHSYPTTDAPGIGRVAALDAGLPVTVTGLQIDRRCGSGLQAVF